MRFSILLCVGLVLSACASDNSIRLREGATYLEQGELLQAYFAIIDNLKDEEKHRAKALALFAPIDDVQNRLADSLQEYQTKLFTFNAAATFDGDVKLAADVGLIAEDRAAALRTQAEDLALGRTLNGVYTPNFGDPWKTFRKVSESPEAMIALTRNSVAYLKVNWPQEGQRRPTLTELSNYIQLSPNTSTESQLVRNALYDIQFSIAELRSDVRKFAPSFAAVELDRKILDFYILGPWPSLDVASIIQVADRFTLVGLPSVAEASVRLREYEFRERTDHRPTRTVVVELDLKPKEKKKGEAKDEPEEEEEEKPQDARYIYDVREGSDRLDWAYEVHITSPDATGTVRKMFRGSYEESYYQCENGRIEDTFGNTRRESYAPDSYTRSYCYRGSERTDPEVFRQRLVRQLAGELTETLARVHNVVTLSGDLSLVY
jgi:hypothetical protein